MRSRIAVATVLLTVLALSGCATKERDELKEKVATLERQLAKANSDLAETNQALMNARANAETASASLKECLTEREAAKKRKK